MQKARVCDIYKEEYWIFFYEPVLIQLYFLNEFDSQQKQLTKTLSVIDLLIDLKINLFPVTDKTCL
jgi:hypothetical protein